MKQKKLTKRPLIALSAHLSLEEPPRRLEYQITLHRRQSLELRCDSVENTRVERRAIGGVGWVQREELGDFGGGAGGEIDLGDISCDF